MIPLSVLDIFLHLRMFLTSKQPLLICCVDQSLDPMINGINSVWYCFLVGSFLSYDYFSILTQVESTYKILQMSSVAVLFRVPRFYIFMNHDI